MASSLSQLQSFAEGLPPTERLPVLFLGHGSPMNAIENNPFVQGFRELGQKLVTPRAILCISAHWETRGTQVTAMKQPKTIHDFGGFPPALYEMQYPAPGSPALAEHVQQLLTAPFRVEHDHQWGLDHGAWTVLMHLFPQANIPVIQMSLDRTQGPEYHYALAQQLRALRRQGVLIVGSGNMVHNLGAVAWDKLNSPYGYDWALEASAKMKEWIVNGNHDPLVAFRSQGRAFDLAIPTPEHYLPLLYCLALQEDADEVDLFNDAPLGGSLTMTSVIYR